MKYVAAYMLAALNGEAPSKAAVKKILESIGADIEAAQFDKVFSELDGKDVNEVVAEGMGMLASVPSGGGAAPAAAAGGAAAEAAPAAEEKKEESEEESDSDMGFDLFG
jgi:large subunit ribosomal protein LP2